MTHCGFQIDVCVVQQVFFQDNDGANNMQLNVKL